jgi:Crp-like helix-turn-helix domain
MREPSKCRISGLVALVFHSARVAGQCCQALFTGVEELIDQPHGVLPKVSQEMLAQMIGTTRSRVNFFMNKFRKLGFIKYNGGLQINLPC